MWSFLLSYIGVLLPPPSPLKWHCAPVSVYLLIHYPSVPAIIFIHAGLFKLNDDFEAPPYAEEEEWEWQRSTKEILVKGQKYGGT